MLLLRVQICTIDLGKEFYKFTAQLENKLFLIRKHNQYVNTLIHDIWLQLVELK